MADRREQAGAHGGRRRVDGRVVDRRRRARRRATARRRSRKRRGSWPVRSAMARISPARRRWPGSPPWRDPRPAPPPASRPSPDSAGRSPRDRPAPMPLRLARYSALSVKYQVIEVMCSGLAPASASMATMLCERLPHLADEIVGLELRLPVPADLSADEDHAGRAPRRRWRSRPASPSLRAAGWCACKSPPGSKARSALSRVRETARPPASCADRRRRPCRRCRASGR